MTQPTALHLADVLDTFHNPHDKQAAAELRRLAGIERRFYELQRHGRAVYEKVEAQRDKLLEALKAAEPWLRHADVDYDIYVQARDAIAKREQNDKPQGKLLPWKGLTEEEHTYYKACGFVGVKAVEEKLRARNSTLACHQGEEGK